jgi:hypothetical protein
MATFTIDSPACPALATYPLDERGAGPDLGLEPRNAEILSRSSLENLGRRNT